MDIKHNIVNELYFNKIKFKKNPLYLNMTYKRVNQSLRFWFPNAILHSRDPAPPGEMADSGTESRHVYSLVWNSWNIVAPERKPHRRKEW